MSPAMPQALSVGEVARRSGVPVSTVHFYEKQGLIAGWRTAGNQRRYHRSVLRRIAIIRISQSAGLPLAIFKDALADLPHVHVPTAADWRNLTDPWPGVPTEPTHSLPYLPAQLLTCTRPH